MNDNSHENSYVIISLTKGRISIVDLDEYDWIKEFRWKCRIVGNRAYAYRRFKKNGKQYTEQMHRLILNAPRGVEVDHINGNGLDNRRSNLRLATTAQNQHNQTFLRSDNTNGFKGVFHDKRHNVYGAQIQVGKKHITKTGYDTPEDAANAYDDLASLYFGEFAYTNKMLKKKS